MPLKNPRISNAGLRALRGELAAASKLYKGFTGNAARVIGRASLPNVPRTAVAIGPVLGIIYAARDGAKRVRYLHQFAQNCQPLLAVSHDGSQLWLLGGRYHFTAQGIVDRPARRLRSRTR